MSDTDQISVSVSEEPALWHPYYVTLFLHLSLLAALVVLPGKPIGWSIYPLAIWMSIFAVLTFFAHSTRILIHDTLVGLSLRERLALGLFTLCLIVFPVFLPHARVLRDGPLCMTPLLLLLAVTPSLARRLLAVTLVGGWLAAFWVRAPWELGLLLAFAASWLFALGMTHLAFTADQFGIWGGWPLVRLARSVGAVLIPAGIAGALAWLFWPNAGVNPGTKQFPAPADPRPLRPADIGSLMQDMVTFIILVIVTITILYFFRRWLLKRTKHSPVGQLLRGQDAQLEYQQDAAGASRPGLSGLRGAIVGLWGKWETALAREEFGRKPGETATEYAERLRKEKPEAAPDAQITELLNKAHYGQAPLGQRDLTKMNELVHDELSKQSLRLQAPQEE